MVGSVEFRLAANAFKDMQEMSFGRLRDLAEDMRERAVDNAKSGPYEPKPPHDTGNNSDSIRMQEYRTGHFMVHTESGYGGWLEIGTEKMPARPYMRDAYRAARQAAESR